MKKILIKTLKLIRPKQWIKNFAVLAPIVFTQQLFNPPILIRALLAFVIFCGLSSSIYVINDIFDIQKDRLHPFKRFRPLAHGDLSIQYAFTLFFLLAIGSLTASFFLGLGFFLLTIVYLVLQLSYSTTLKHIAILDILALASGYILRVYGGEAATGYHISVWLILTTVSLSLFLAVGKRRSELTLISG